VNTATTITPADEGVIEAHQLAAYLVLLNDRSETFQSRWAKR
jgi:hypothetical protein